MYTYFRKGEFNRVPIINGVNSAEGIISAIDYVVGKYQEIISVKLKLKLFYLRIVIYFLVL